MISSNFGYLSPYRFNHISVQSTTQEQSTTTLAATTTTVETTSVSVYEITEHTTTVPDAALTPTDRVATSEPQGVNVIGNNVVKTKNLSFSFSRDFAYGYKNNKFKIFHSVKSDTRVYWPYFPFSGIAGQAFVRLLHSKRATYWKHVSHYATLYIMPWQS